MPILADTAFWMALLLATFTILFGTRHLDASERHEGMVAAIAFESLVKLVAFLAVGIFVTFGIYDGLADIFARARGARAARERCSRRSAARPAATRAGRGSPCCRCSRSCSCRGSSRSRSSRTSNENHLGKAIWLFPLYMLAINLFVLPIAFGGVLHFPARRVDPDTFVLTLPMAEKQEALALFVFIGGLSAATGMVIVETIALSTMVCNDLVMPVLLRMQSLRLAERQDLTGLLLGIRRGAIVAVLLLGYLYFRLAGEAYALVAIGLISFAAVAQFAPAILGGIYWKGATRAGALAGLGAGFAVWLYTLLLPSFAKSGWLPHRLPRARPVRHRAAEAVRAVRPRGPERHHARDALEHDRQHRRLRRGVGADPAERGRAGAGGALRRRVPARRRRARRARLEGHGVAAGPAGAARALSRRRSAPQAAVADYARAARLRARRRDAGRRRARAVRRDRRSPARSAARRRGSWSPRRSRRTRCRSTRCATMLDEASQVIAYSHELEQKSRELDRARRPSCAPPTSGCRSSTGSRTTSSRPSRTSCARR